MALAIAGFLGIGLWGLMHTQNRTYGQQDNTSQMQQNLRAAVDKISTDLLSVGQGPGSALAGIAWYTTANSWQPYAFDNVNMTLDLLGCTSGVVGVLAGNAASGATVITLNSASGFTASAGAVNSYVSIGGVEVRKVTAVGANTLTLATALGNNYSLGTQVCPLQWVRYAVNTAANPTQLTRDAHDGNGAQVIAYYVTTLNTTVPQAPVPAKSDWGTVRVTLTGLKAGYNAAGSTAVNTIHIRNS